MRTKTSGLLLAAAAFVAVLALASSDAAPQEDAAVPAAVPVNSTVAAANVTQTNNTSANSTAGESAGESSSSSQEGEKDDDDEGTSESLYDFLMDILKQKAANVSKSVSGEPAVPAPQATSNSSSAAGAAGAPASGDNDDDDYDDEEYEDEDDEYEYDYYEDSTTPGNDADGPFSPNGMPNCAVAVDLSDFCYVDDNVKAYFKDNMKLEGVRAPIFDMGIVERLKQCPRGEWCLGNEMEKLKALETSFYRGPLCDESMWECLFDIIVQRDKCSDKEFRFIVDAADMLCDLFETRQEADKGNVCFAHALAALHVTYADLLTHNMSSVSTSTTTTTTEPESTCDGTAYRMTKTYLCADGSCGRYFDAKLAMEEFPRWNWFMDRVDEIVEDCDLDNVCGSLAVPEEANQQPNKWFGMTTTSSSWYDYEEDEDSITTTTGGPWEAWDDEYPGDGETSNNVGDRLAKADESLMVALSVGSAVGLLFMVLGLLFWRRSRRRNLYYSYRSDQYNKLPPDAAHLLPYNDRDRDLD